ncbi:hypothetical protein [Echinococcus multilocularis]|uniref:Uncharacterized protein n=1 Tax=Echinococcus multilocularis TaxID=6211 RepID=A0A068Y2T8_ECHMU|nr:hypothetical protein [Echinococcus multilocularis]
MHHGYVFVYSTFNLVVYSIRVMLERELYKHTPPVNFWDNSILHRKRVSVPNIVPSFWPSAKRIESSRSSEGNFIYYETQFRSTCVAPNDRHPDFIVAASSTRSTVGDFLFMLVRQRDKLLITLDEES